MFAAVVMEDYVRENDTFGNFFKRLMVITLTVSPAIACFLLTSQYWSMELVFTFRALVPSAFSGFILFGYIDRIYHHFQYSLVPAW